MPTTMTPVVLRLKQLREQAGLTQAQLADDAGVRQATISDLENGKSQRIEFALLDALCAALERALGREVTPGELLEREVKRKRGR